VRQGGCFDLPAKKKEIAQLEVQVSEPTLWNNPQEAQELTKKLAERKEIVGNLLALESRIVACGELLHLGNEEGDERVIADCVTEAEKLAKAVATRELLLFLNGPYDAASAILTFQAGAGGTDAQDWAQMLLQMYLRYAEGRGWSARIVDEHKGAEAGLKSATVLIEGMRAYGWLKFEAGVHRLVRISPFDAEKMRHTSFVRIEVLPELAEQEEVTMDTKDLRIDTFLASGHGGQSVQTTYSAVRITHLPTGIMVSCQNERSQTQNKENALKILRGKLALLAQAERKKETQMLRGDVKAAEWGSQIRSYVLHPYKQVKDLRTHLVSKDPEAMLDGDVQEFLEAEIKHLTKQR